MKLISDKRGSTLLLTLIITAVLTITGTALISMAFFNLNIKYSQDRNKKAVYFSESGIEQVYAYVGSKVEDTLELAKDDTDIFKSDMLDYLEATVVVKTDEFGEPLLDAEGDYIYEDYIGEVREDFFVSKGFSSMDAAVIIKELKLKTEDNQYVKVYIQDEDKNIVYKNKVIDDVVLKQALDGYYKYSFKKNFDDNYTDIDTSIEMLEGLENCVINVGEVQSFSQTAENIFRLKNLESKFNLVQNGEIKASRSIVTDIVIKAPENLYPFITIEDTVLVENNPLWQNAIVAGGDIYFEGSEDKKVEITGDVYGYGTKGKGISLQGGADVKITGDLISKNYIQTTGNEDELKVFHGLVYCDTLETKAGADNSNIYLKNSSLFTRDDIELNALKSDILIENGSYYGFSDGTELAAEHDNSSAVIINAPLYKEGDPIDENRPATINIEGNSPSLIPSGIQLFEAKKSFAEPGVWVFGTAYADFVGTDSLDNTKLWPYQTGESVSIKGNYLAYTIPLTVADDELLFLKYDNRHTIFNKASIGPVYNEEKAIELATGTTLEGLQYFNSNDKIAYFMKAYDLYPELFEKGTPSSMAIKNYRYVLGAKVKDNGDFDSQNQAVDLLEYPQLRKEIRHDYIYYLINGKNYKNDENPSVKPVYPAEENISDDLYFPDYPSDFYNIVSEFIGYNQEVSGILDNPLAKETVDYLYDLPDYPGQEKATQFFYISNYKEGFGYKKTNIRLIGKNHGDAVEGYIDITSENDSDEGIYQGILVTEGDIIIDGDIEFAGTIIAGGDIIFRNGSNTSRINNSQLEAIEFLAVFIRNNPSVRSILKRGESGEPIRFVRQEQVEPAKDPDTSEDISNIKTAFYKLVKLEFWRLK